MSTSSENQEQSQKKRKVHKKILKAVPKRQAGQKETVEKESGGRQQHKEEQKENKLPRYRVFPIWLRIVLVAMLCGLALMLGLMFGYGVIGDGNPREALELDTWRRIWNIITGE